jgi:hypothetical protein
MFNVVSATWLRPRLNFVRLIVFACCGVAFHSITADATAADVPVAPANAPPPAHLRLTLDEALERAESASALIRRSRSERASVAALDVGASLALPSNPVVAFSAGPRREVAGSTRADGVQMAGHIEQTFEIAGQRGTRRNEVTRLVDAAAWRENAARVETRARVRAAYVGALLARRRGAPATPGRSGATAGRRCRYACRHGRGIVG